ncbi:ABC-type nitrate/sulfonate/bicarbonate transport system substrate-binding protein [Paraburkholderia sp. HC6.4b]|uniref:ABC transporter substrate-binding protein n=1 Tax=unclassified Paraburkholderia TaxID=2615204 RepID=UPI00161F87CA|nr:MULTISPECIES: ABC transporter substrate-binding protein [unclassified Paraburkholderia]MBB5406320.1 ABC-type nitrate/sulfonate/bicarbonate transport system substrate-binding protein [Paraburkholderia sp. HC6.4b]MBB5448718.1 ABC-type nitrate/sulfonate/bicarbonate transport system substrate-binding protein [Paraburkholderia sp. Kb1A]
MSQMPKEVPASFDTFTLSRRSLLIKTLAMTAGGCCLPGLGWGRDKSYSGALALPLYKELTDNIPLIVGFDKGFFADAGLDLKPVSYSVPSDVIRAVTTNTDIGAASVIAGIAARTRGFDELRIIGTLMGKLSLDFVVPVNSSIRTSKDLAGKTIGVNVPSSIVTYFAKSMLREAGLDPEKDVKLIDVKGAGPGATALENGLVDCTWSTAPLQTQLELTNKVRSIYKCGEHFPHMQQTAIYSTSSFLDKHGATATTYLRIVAKCQEFVTANPEAAARIYAKFLGIDEAIAAKVVMAVAPGYVISVSRGGMDANIRAAKSLGLLEKQLNYSDIVDLRFAQAAT